MTVSRSSLLLIVASFGCTQSPPATTNDAGTAPSDTGVPFTPAPHPPFPDLMRRGGSELDAIRLVVIAAQGDPLADQFFAFGDALLASQWLPAAVHDYDFTHVGATPSVHVTGPAMAASVGMRALRTYVNTIIAGDPSLTPDGHTLYVVFYPPGTSFPNNCGFDGEHTELSTMAVDGAPTDALAFIQRCGAPPGDTELDTLTSIASHEIAEAISDARGPTGYALPDQRERLVGTSPPWAISSWSYAQTGAVENGDLCEGARIQESGHAYQRIWSTQAAMAEGDPCVPPLSEPYYSATAATDWIEVPAGTTTMIPITGWSTGPRADWTLTVDRTDYAGRFTASFGGMPTTRINNGRTAMLTIDAPMIPGQFAAFRIYSSPNGRVPTSGGGTNFPLPPSGDRYHYWVFGVHSSCASCPMPASSCGDGTCDAPTNENCESCPDDCGSCELTCGASAFTTRCGSTFCPAHSTCSAGACTCDTGFVETACDGTLCGTSCSYPDYRCAPTSCGMTNWTTSCGTGTCPGDAQCLPSDRCGCPEGTQASTCDGQPCTGGVCNYPDYWCAVCGVANFTVPCAGGRNCPAFSTCNSDGSCSCNAGYHSESCAGDYCGSGNCPYPSWWCVSSSF